MHYYIHIYHILEDERSTKISQRTEVVEVVRIVKVTQSNKICIEVKLNNHRI